MVVVTNALAHHQRARPGGHADRLGDVQPDAHGRLHGGRRRGHGPIVTVRERVHGDANVVPFLDPGREPVLGLLAAGGAPALSALQTRQASVMAYADAWGWPRDRGLRGAVPEPAAAADRDRPHPVVIALRQRAGQAAHPPGDRIDAWRPRHDVPVAFGPSGRRADPPGPARPEDGVPQRVRRRRVPPAPGGLGRQSRLRDAVAPRNAVRRGPVRRAMASPGPARTRQRPRSLDTDPSDERPRWVSLEADWSGIWGPISPRDPTSSGRRPHLDPAAPHETPPSATLMSASGLRMAAPIALERPMTAAAADPAPSAPNSRMLQAVRIGTMPHEAVPMSLAGAAAWVLRLDPPDRGQPSRPCPASGSSSAGRRRSGCPMSARRAATGSGPPDDVAGPPGAPPGAPPRTPPQMPPLGSPPSCCWPCTAAAAPGPAADAPVQMSGDWLAACDNLLDCAAYGFGADDAPAVLLVGHDRDRAPTATLILRADAPRPLAAVRLLAPRHGPAITVRLRPGAAGTLRGAPVGRRGRAAAAGAAWQRPAVAAADRQPRGQALGPAPAPASRRWASFRLAGAAPALDWIEARQRRKPELPAPVPSPAPPPIPVRRPARAACRPPSPPSPRCASAAARTPRPRPTTSPPPGSPPPSACGRSPAAAATSTAPRCPCWRRRAPPRWRASASRPASRSARPACWSTSRPARTGASSAADEPSRGLGDCGDTRTYRWDGVRYRLVSARLMPACHGLAPEDWPVVYRAAR